MEVQVVGIASEWAGGLAGGKVGSCVAGWGCGWVNALVGGW